MAIYLLPRQIDAIHDALAGPIIKSAILIIPLVKRTPYYRPLDYTFSDVDSAMDKVNLLLLILAAEDELRGYPMKATS